MAVLEFICIGFLALMFMVPIMYPCNDIAEAGDED